ncbi:MAG: tetratricopeptide repeat protein [Bacteroidota bacterium]
MILIFCRSECKILKDVKTRYPNWMLADPMQFLHLSYLEYYRKGKIDEAIEIMQLELEYYLEYLYGHYWLGRYFEEKGMKEKALQAYKKALSLDKSFGEAKDRIEVLKKELKVY